MNRVDAVTLLILALYGFTGYRRGFLAVALDWLGLTRAYFAMIGPGHRANILNPAYHHVGIGALRALRFGIMFSQEFAN